MGCKPEDMIHQPIRQCSLQTVKVHGKMPEHAKADLIRESMCSQQGQTLTATKKGTDLIVNMEQIAGLLHSIHDWLRGCNLEHALQHTKSMLRDRVFMCIPTETTNAQMQVCRHTQSSAPSGSW